MTGEATEEVLDASHIQPYVNKESDHVQNGLPLRADFHRLFDAGLITVDDDYRIVLGDHLESVTYASYDGQQILMPHEAADKPSREALKVHRGLVFRAESLLSHGRLHPSQTLPNHLGKIDPRPPHHPN